MSRIDLEDLKMKSSRSIEIASRMARWRWFLRNCHRFFPAATAQEAPVTQEHEQFSIYVETRNKSQQSYLTRLSDCVNRPAFKAALASFEPEGFAENTIDYWFHDPFKKGARPLTADNARRLSLFFMSHRLKVEYRRIVLFEEPSLIPVIETVACELEQRHDLKCGSQVRDYLLLVWALNKRFGQVKGGLKKQRATTRRELREKLDLGVADEVDVESVGTQICEWVDDLTLPKVFESMSSLVPNLIKVWKNLLLPNSRTGISFVQDCDDAFSII